MQQDGEGTANDAVVRNGDDATDGKDTMVASRFASFAIELMIFIFVKIVPFQSDFVTSAIRMFSRRT